MAERGSLKKESKKKEIPSNVSENKSIDNIRSSGNISDDHPLHSNRVVLIFSGGMDSTTLLYRLLHENKEVFTLSFNYGQKHIREVDAAKKTAIKLNVPHKVVDLSSLKDSGLFGSSSLTSYQPVPEGHYAAENMKSTVVPNRNMIMLSMALAYAITLDAAGVYYAAHAGDHAIYPDCRPAFVDAMQDVSLVCHYYPITIEAPYLYVTKSEILAEGLKLGVDYSLTWTCYKGGQKACGKCGSCTERLEAFQKNKVKDPLQYES